MAINPQPIIPWNYTSQTSGYTAAANDWVLCSGASFTVTLPTAVGIPGQSIMVESAGSSLTQVFTINTTSSQTITWQGTAYTSGQVAAYTNSEVFIFTSNGTNWNITRHDTDTVEASAGVLAITASSAYSFTIASSTIAAGTVYTNNGQTFIVSTSTVASTNLLCYGTGAPSAATSTLTFVSGTSGNKSYTAISSAGVPVYGTVTYNRFLWSRRANRIIGRWECSATGNGTAGTGQYAFYYPTGLLPDMTNMSQNTAVLTTVAPVTPSLLGQGFVFGSGAAGIGYFYPGFPTIFHCFASGNGVFSSGSFNVLQSTSRWSLLMDYPVANWIP